MVSKVPKRVLIVCNWGSINHTRHTRQFLNNLNRMHGRYRSGVPWFSPKRCYLWCSLWALILQHHMLETFFFAWQTSFHEADITSGSLGDLEAQNLGVSEGQQNYCLHFSCGVFREMHPSFHDMCRYLIQYLSI